MKKRIASVKNTIIEIDEHTELDRTPATRPANRHTSIRVRVRLYLQRVPPTDTPALGLGLGYTCNETRQQTHQH